MNQKIEKVAVIGSGVMGSGIAAHFANANVSVLLLDQLQSGFGKKNILAEQALERMLKAEPAAFMSPHHAKNITVGNLQDDFYKLQECDWIVEAIVEKLDIKRDLYKKIEEIIKPTTLISSNTSTLPLHQLIEGRSEIFQQNFSITHFFNPPRYMRLLEIVRSPKMKTEIFEILKNFCDIKLGKGVVECHDTPGFIGNRIGTYWLQTALLQAFDKDISIEAVDALFSRPFGMPKTGVFGLMDLIGIDLIPLISQSMCKGLPSHDPFCQNYKELDIINTMISKGWIGRKGAEKSGFYRLRIDNNNKIKESIDLKSGLYHRSKPEKLAVLDHASYTPVTLRHILDSSDRYGQYAWSVLSEVLIYAASLVPEISDDIVGIDQAMKLGFNWKYGPFELIDRLGANWFVEKLKKENRFIPNFLEKAQSCSFYKIQDGQQKFLDILGHYKNLVRPSGHLLLSDIKLKSSALLKNSSASLWDIGDGVVCLEFHSKMNTIDLYIMTMIRQSIDLVKKNFKALVIYNEGSHFSAGANLGHALFLLNVGLWSNIKEMIQEGQQTYKALKYAPFPVVSAPSGMALGGGCEILLHSSSVQAHAESYIGLVEVGVGLIPAWGGCKEMLLRVMLSSRLSGPLRAISKIFETIGMAKVSTSAFQAKDMLYLNSENGITMNRDRLLSDAKLKALSMVEGYNIPKPSLIKLPGQTVQIALILAVKALKKMGKISEYDEEISKKLAYILTGGDTDISNECDEDSISNLEIKAFIDLMRNPLTLARIEHMLETGKPLRN